jgi:HD superfamily phosphohydrolase
MANDMEVSGFTDEEIAGLNKISGIRNNVMDRLKDSDSHKELEVLSTFAQHETSQILNVAKVRNDIRKEKNEQQNVDDILQSALPTIIKGIVTVPTNTQYIDNESKKIQYELPDELTEVIDVEVTTPSGDKIDPRNFDV